MSISVSCCECSKSFKVKERYAGKLGACPFCGAMLQVPDESLDLVASEEPQAATSTSSLSLMTQVPMEPCPACKKQILVGSESCFYCKATLSAGSNPKQVDGESAALNHIKQVVAGAQSAE